MSVKYEKDCAIIRTSCTRVEHVRNDVTYDNYNAHVAVESFIMSHQQQNQRRRSLNERRSRRKAQERNPSASDLMKGKCSASKHRITKRIEEIYLPLKHVIVKTADEAKEKKACEA